MNNIQNTKNRRNSRSFLLNALLIAFLFILNVSAFGNGVTNAGNTNARITDARERVKRMNIGEYINGNLWIYGDK